MGEGRRRSGVGMLEGGRMSREKAGVGGGVDGVDVGASGGGAGKVEG